MHIDAENEILHLALIINEEFVRRLNESYDKLEKDGSEVAKRKMDNPAYYFVELSTEDFKNKGAHLNGNDKPLDEYLSLIGTLDTVDRIALREEVLRDGSPCSKFLKDHVEKLQFEDVEHK